MKPIVIFLRLMILLPSILILNSIIRANDDWIQVRSKNFYLIGNADEKDIKQAAVKLEEFRAALGQVLDQYNFNSPVPTRVIVFKTAADYKPFKPLKKNGETDDFIKGNFLAGKDVNYISLSTEGDPARVYQIIFHEYAHFLLNNNLGKSNIPPWFNEGFAVYYETFAVDKEQRIILGTPPAKHLELLRRNDLIPLETFFDTDNLSLHEQGDEGVGLFYAQAWALFHYFIHSDNGTHKPQLDRFLNLVMAGENSKTAFTEAFQTAFPAFEKELRKYIDKKSFNISSLSLKEKFAAPTDLKTENLTESDVQGYLGDFLFHSNRLNEAEILLQKALKLNPDSIQAQISLGLIRLKQQDFIEAEKHLKKAVNADSDNYLINFYYAYALSRIGMTNFGFVIRYDAEDADKMRAALKKAVELNPDHAESYDLYAFVNIIRNENLNEAIEYLDKALSISPGNQWYSIHLAEAYLGKQEFSKAREIAARITATAGEKEIKVYSQSTLRRIISTEAAYEEIRKNKDQPRENPLDRELTDEELAQLRVRQINESLNESLYKPKQNEKRIFGTLTEIECRSKEIIYMVEVGDQNLRLTSATFDSVRFISFNSAMAFSQIGCGSIKNRIPAVVNYKPAENLKTDTSGEVVSIEFVPFNFSFTN
ncbi:MAG: tetratricopeptide repeat protein [Pyrinomonadaceae bacterium]